MGCCAPGVAPCKILALPAALPAALPPCLITAWDPFPVLIVLCAANGLTAITHNNIYGVVDALGEHLSQYMPSVTEEVVTGTAEIKALFPTPRGGSPGASCRWSLLPWLAIPLAALPPWLHISSVVSFLTPMSHWKHCVLMRSFGLQTRPSLVPWSLRASSGRLQGALEG